MPKESHIWAYHGLSGSKTCPQETKVLPLWGSPEQQWYLETWSLGLGSLHTCPVWLLLLYPESSLEGSCSCLARAAHQHAGPLSAAETGLIPAWSFWKLCLMHSMGAVKRERVTKAHTLDTTLGCVAPGIVPGISGIPVSCSTSWAASPAPEVLFCFIYLIFKHFVYFILMSELHRETPKHCLRWG